ncbi:MAG: SCO family protein [Candidatus Hodarchaeota archaeon]
MEKRNIYMLLPAIVALIVVIGGAFVLYPLLNPPLPIVREAPDFTLINQDSEEVNLSDFNGKVVLMGFMYTSCPDAEFCILMNSNFKTLQDEFGERMGPEIVFLSISLDPERDTPEILKTFGTYYQADFSAWQFLTGDNATVHEVLDDYNVIAFKEMPENSTMSMEHSNITMGGNETMSHHNHYIVIHNWVTVIVDQDGMIRREYGKLDWDVETAKADILSLLV